MQFSLRGAVRTRTLDALLKDKEVIDRSVADYLKERIKALGTALEGFASPAANSRVPMTDFR